MNTVPLRDSAFHSASERLCMSHRCSVADAPLPRNAARRSTANTPPTPRLPATKTTASRSLTLSELHHVYRSASIVGPVHVFSELQTFNLRSVDLQDYLENLEIEGDQDHAILKQFSSGTIGQIQGIPFDNSTVQSVHPICSRHAVLTGTCSQWVCQATAPTRPPPLAARAPLSSLTWTLTRRAF